MARRIFDQAELKSAKAQHFADAFAGCDEWIELPRRRRDDRSSEEMLDGPGAFSPFDQYLDAEPAELRRRRAA